MENGQIKQSKIDAKKIRKSIDKRIQYTSAYFGFENIAGDGKFVRLCVIDSGVPTHGDIRIDIDKTKNFTNSGSVYDVFGHSTAITGIIAANNKRAVTGMAAEADLYFAKAIVDDPQDSKISSVIDALLWCIVRDVDLVLMSFGTNIEHEGLHDAIKKVHRNGIAMIAASGNCTNKTKDVDFPARYDEVFSVGYSNNINYMQPIKNANNYKGLIMPQQSFATTFMNSQFIDMSGSSINAAIVAGLGILAYQSLRRRGIDAKKPQVLYNEIGKLAVKK
jgi:subtilisin